jgi:hypothetical protein
MITNSQLAKVSAAFRVQYLTQKTKSTSKIMESYFSASKLVGARLATGPYKFEPNYAPLIIADAQKTIEGTTAGIVKTFAEEIESVNQVAVAEAQTIAVLSGYSGNYGSIIAALAKNNAIAQVFESLNLAKVPLSGRIWNPTDRHSLVSIIKTGLTERESPFQIAQKLIDYSQSGNGRFNAYRLAYTETTFAYNNTTIDTTNAWNEDPDANFQVIIEQYLSFFHKHTDICDALQGRYDPKLAPVIPRHPLCNCGWRRIIADKKVLQTVKDNYNRLGKDVIKVITKQQPVKPASLAAPIVPVKPKLTNLDVGPNQYNVEFGKITTAFKGDALQKQLSEFFVKVPDSEPLKKTFLKTAEMLGYIEDPMEKLKALALKSSDFYDFDVKTAGLSGDGRLNDFAPDLIKTVSIEKIYEGEPDTSAGVQRWIERIKAGEKPVINVRYTGEGMFTIIDGNHRYVAYQKLKIKNVPIIEEADLKAYFYKVKAEQKL